MTNNQNLFLKGVVIVLCVSLFFFPMKMTVWGASSMNTIDLADTETAGGNNWTYDNVTKVFTINDGANVTITGTVSGDTTVVVAENAKANVTLAGITHITPIYHKSPFSLKSGAEVELILAAGSVNMVKGGGEAAGIHVPYGTKLKISGTGELTASGGSIGAGIGTGGNSGTSAGEITITGGTVNAVGGLYSAGIGGGPRDGGGIVNIAGGTVNATGTAFGGNGIGGGMNNGGGGSTSISGGVVTVVEGDDNGVDGAAGISNTLTMNGDGILFASSIRDKSPKDKGILFDGNTGTVYGDVTLTVDISISEDKTLNISENNSITVSPDTTLTNNGTINNQGLIDNLGTINNAGSVENQGIINNQGDIGNEGTIVNDGTINGTAVSGNQPIIKTVPGAPQEFRIAPGKGMITLTWAAPIHDGNSAITGYKIQLDDNEIISKTALDFSHIFSGLITGRLYTVKIWAVNSIGDSTLLTNTVTLLPTPTTNQLNFTLASKPYTGKAQSVNVTPKAGVGDVTIYYTGTGGTSYAKSIKPPVNAGTYIITADVKAGTSYDATSGLDLGTFTIARANLSKVSLSVSNMTWTGKQLKPKLSTFTYGGTRFSVGANATVAKYGSNKSIGKGSVIITGKGNFTGSKAISFNIVPKKNKISKVTSGKKQLKIKFTKVSKAQKINGYQVRYKQKTAKKWSSPKNISKSKSTYTIKKLKKGKTYQIQIRSYKKVGSTKYYSAWSATKTSKKVK